MHRVVIVSMVCLLLTACQVGVVKREALTPATSAVPTPVSSPDARVTVRPTATPTPSPLPSTTATPTPSPSATYVPIPSATIYISPPTPTALPTQTPTPCAIPIAPEFSPRFGARPDIALVLGCPTTERQRTWTAEERFQYGRMFWQHHTDMIYILYDYSGTYQVEPDSYVEGDPQDACPEVGQAPEGLFKPVRGFNRQWCRLGGAWALGWALERELGYNAVWQEFERAYVLQNHAEHILIFYDDGVWYGIE